MTLAASPLRRAQPLNGGAAAAPAHRILCVDDHAIVFQGLKAGLQTEADIQCVAWRGDANDLLAAVDSASATIVLIDVDMPGVSAFEAIEELHRDRPNVRAIVLSAFTRDHYIDAALAAGAWGYLSKTDDFDTLIAAIRKVARGEFAFGPAALARCEMIDGRLRLKGDAARGVSRLSALTAQEIQVLRLIATGASTREIASSIHRSEKRVEAIRTNILKKLGLEDRVELTRFAIREGLVEP